jgi:hypothetical protein
MGDGDTMPVVEPGRACWLASSPVVTYCPTFNPLCPTLRSSNPRRKPCSTIRLPINCCLILWWNRFLYASLASCVADCLAGPTAGATGRVVTCAAGPTAGLAFPTPVQTSTLFAIFGTNPFTFGSNSGRLRIRFGVSCSRSARGPCGITLSRSTRGISFVMAVESISLRGTVLSRSALGARGTCFPSPLAAPFAATVLVFDSANVGQSDLFDSCKVDRSDLIK